MKCKGKKNTISQWPSEEPDTKEKSELIHRFLLNGFSTHYLTTCISSKHTKSSCKS